MEWNIGALDRTIRFFVGVILGIFALSGSIKGNLLIVFIIISAYLLLSGIRSFCLIYRILGISTLSKGR